MLEPIQQSKEYSVRTPEELNTLLTVNNIASLEVAAKAMLEFSTIVKIITQNKSSLVKITFDGWSGGEFTVSSNDAELLANAVKSCTGLRSLTIKHFFNSFRENIKYFSQCLEDHPDLDELSFHNTYLGEYATGLFKKLETHQKLKTIHLSNTALIYRANWDQFAFALKNNSSLEKLILWRTATRLLAVSSVLDGIISSSNRIKSLQWDFQPLVESEELHWKSDKAVNWGGDKGRDVEVDNLLHQVEDYRRTGQHLLVSDYKVAEVKFRELKTFMSERKGPPKTSLSVTISNEYNFSLALLTAKIALHSNNLSELNILMDSIESDNPWYSDQDFSNFIATLKKCVNLRQFKFEHMQGIFKSEQIGEILRVLCSFPQLQILSLKKTYIGPLGMKNLFALLQKNKITTLDLTLSGLIDNHCFRILAGAIESNTSLETITFENSPMTAMWLQILIEGIRRRSPHTSLKIIWRKSEKEVMESQMRAMCSDLARDRRVTDTALANLMNDTLKIFYSQRSVDLTPSWLALQNLVKATTYQKLSGVLPKDPKKDDEVALEMQPVATTSSRLLNRGGRSYGTGAGVSTHTKDTQSGPSLK